MNKKFVATLALVLVVATALFAGISFGGDATVGYKFAFDGSYTGTYGADAKVADIGLSATTDFAKVAFRGILSTTTASSEIMASANSLDVEAQVSLYLTKALAAAGLELPVSATAYVGNAQVSGYSVYTDPTGYVGDNLGYRSTNAKRNYPIALDVAYEDIIAVRGEVDFVGGDNGYLLSAKSIPVPGVAVALSFANKPNRTAGDYGISFSATADIAELADMDFDLAVSGIGYVGFGGTDAGAKNKYLASVTAGYDAFEAAVEYRYGIANATANGLYLRARYYGVENLGLSAGFGFQDFANIDVSTMDYFFKAAYTLGGVTYWAKICNVTSTACSMDVGLTLSF